jgi:hypothetical protein
MADEVLLVLITDYFFIGMAVIDVQRWDQNMWLNWHMNT